MAMRWHGGLAGTYGDSTNTPQIILGPSGEVLSIVNVAIAGAADPFEVGDLMWSARSSKTGWLLCDGSEILRSSDLGAYLVSEGMPFGVGNGTTTVNLPDGRDNMLVGADDSFVVGDTGGQTEFGHTENFTIPPHTHNAGTLAGPSHTHSGTTLTADVTIAAATPGAFINRVSNATANWNATHEISGAGAGSTATNRASGAQVQGNTGAGGTGAVTGSTGSTLSADDVLGGILDHTGVRPPFLAANLFIKE